MNFYFILRGVSVEGLEIATITVCFKKMSKNSCISSLRQKNVDNCSTIVSNIEQTHLVIYSSSFYILHFTSIIKRKECVPWLNIHHEDHKSSGNRRTDAAL